MYCEVALENMHLIFPVCICPQYECVIFRGQRLCRNHIYDAIHGNCDGDMKKSFAMEKAHRVMC